MKKASKKQRQSRILQIVGERNIETQSDLVDALQAIGMDVTQATISRDIKELGIVKVMTGEGSQKYVALTHSGEAASGRMKRVFSDAVVSIDKAGSLVVIKTLPGMAQGAASAMDSMYLDEVVGTLAGDDTVFIAAYGEESAVNLQRKLKELARISFQEDEER
ncbi:MAG TPA: arginine repressor [Bacillota bacterium]|jgi:transcriptional regulator of arginine metabolism|nr:arginine repressor [Fastidiosipila sp.]HPX92954.1 arginine repressor [Bacillota bacterium]HQB80768.1 arginine repressor [Bacillota bacterium]